MKRVISGAIGIPLVLGLVLYGSPLLFFCFVVAVVAIASYEYFSMIANMGVEGYQIEGGVLGFILLVGFYLGAKFLGIFAVLLPVVLFTTWFVRGKNISVALDPIAYTLLGIIYTAGLGGYFILIRDLDGGSQIIIFLLLLVWAGDVAAYYGG